MSRFVDSDSVTLSVEDEVLSAEMVVDLASTNTLAANDDGLFVAPQNQSGWFEVTAAAWAWAGADTPTFTAVASGNLTSIYKVGMRFWAVQATDEFFIITSVGYNAGTGLTTLTLYGGTDYSLAATSIGQAFYSVAQWPTGFPADPSKWTVRVVDDANNVQESSSQNVWYQPGSLQIDVPIGAWYLGYSAALGTTSESNKLIQSTLSTDGTTETNPELTGGFTSNGVSLEFTVGREAEVVVDAKATYDLLCRNTATGGPTIGFYGADICETIIEARSAYL